MRFLCSDTWLGRLAWFYSANNPNIIFSRAPVRSAPPFERMMASNGAPSAASKYAAIRETPNQGQRSHRGDHTENDNGFQREGPPAWKGMRSQRKLKNFAAMRSAWESKAAAATGNGAIWPEAQPRSRYRQDMGAKAAAQRAALRERSRMQQERRRQERDRLREEARQQYEASYVTPDPATWPKGPSERAPLGLSRTRPLADDEMPPPDEFDWLAAGQAEGALGSEGDAGSSSTPPYHANMLGADGGEPGWIAQCFARCFAPPLPPHAARSPAVAFRPASAAVYSSPSAGVPRPPDLPRRRVQTPGSWVRTPDGAWTRLQPRLPSEWAEARDEEGEAYFWNRASGEVRCCHRP